MGRVEGHENVPEFELGVCWEEALMVGWTAKGLFATSLVLCQRAVATRTRRMSRTGSKVGL